MTDGESTPEDRSPAAPQPVALLIDGTEAIIHAAAWRLCRQGMAVVLCVAEFATRTALTDEAAARGLPITVIAADLSGAEGIRRIIDTVLSDFGRLDSLVLGPTPRSSECRTGSLLKLPHGVATALSRWSACIDSVIPPMTRSGGGQIVSIVSSAGRYRSAYFRPESDPASYAVEAGVDSAILGLTRQLAFELAPRKIRLNAIAKGWIAAASDPPETTAPSGLDRELLLEEIPLARPGEPDEVAAAIEFLASDASSYLTGEVIDVNGGWWMS